MMRWLKEKKRGEKKHDDAYKEEDDYGFEKEKTPNKSPVIKRQLPPTPAAPEEKSTHIYEEIPDLHVSCVSDHERTSKSKKQGKSKTPSSIISNNHKNNGASGADNSCLDDSISPYMVVPVDEEVRQTPPHFHRNGTPEVHCDLIVKDTHCEILLTRKPKVGAFRLDSTTGSDNGSAAAGAAPSGIRNNTHFCSLNRRASVDVQTGAAEGKGASAFSWSSSAFSSASTSRVNSMGMSTMSLSTLPEHHHHGHGQIQPMTLTEADSGGSNGSSVKGVMTYSSASNFIPRAKKLVFKPLTPLDPDFFDAPDQSLVNLMNADNAPPQEKQAALQLPLGDDDASIEYTSVQGQPQPESDSPLVYSSIQNDQLYDDDQAPLSQTQLLRQQCRPSTPPSLQEIRQTCHANISDSPLFRSHLIRPYSPSTSSSCTYASVNFPPESRLYNTIQGMDLPEPLPGSVTLSLPRSLNKESESMLHPGIQGEVCGGGGDNMASRPSFPNKYSSGDFQSETMYPDGHSHNPHGADAPHQCPNFTAIKYNDGSNNIVPMSDRARRGYQGGGSSEGAIYSGVVNPCDFNNDTTYACIDAKEEESTTANHTTSSLLQNKMDGRLVLDFCTCQDYQQYSSCGCSDINVKADDDDDNASVATTVNEPPKSSCSGCGRLIRQITYSESYSDETYEHAYSSRLLLRRGRRFSSPDITMSEISNSESQDFRLRQGGSPFGSVTRDDMWSISRDDMWSLSQQNYDVRSTFYKPDGEMDSAVEQQHPRADHPVVLNGGRDQQSSTASTNMSNNGVGQRLVTQRKSVCAFNFNDKELGSKVPGGLPQLKRTSLPLNPMASSLVNDEQRSGKASAMAQLQPKSSAFSGLFSKFSRPKVKPPVKAGDEVIGNKNSNTLLTGNGTMNQDQMSDPSSKFNSSVNHIPEKNTLKLSKLFNRMSSKEGCCEPQLHAAPGHPESSDWKNMTGLRVDLDEPAQKLKSQQDRCPLNPYTAIPHHVTSGTDSSFEVPEVTKGLPNKNNHNNDATSAKSNNFEKGSSSNYLDKFTDDATKSKTLADISSDIGSTPTFPCASSINAKPSAISTAEQPASSVFSSAPEASGMVKAGNKTDSGDTCYEYDISTSSESEHTSYDYFLSKVKKSLNLEKEVQHIADMNALRKKLLCKLCKKGATSSPEQCEMCGVDGACTHISSLKCSDWRKFFGELVVDQRAAILDCLTDFTHSPYTVKGDGLASDSNHCRECGGEIMTSDSESLTTVYSLLSQHLPMASPAGAHTPSCDSDEGTMADNSGESGDEEKHGRRGDDSGGDSSGFDDDPTHYSQIDHDHQHHVASAGDKPKRRDKSSSSSSKEKRDKKDHSHSHSQNLLSGSRRKSHQSSLLQDNNGLEERDNFSSSSTAENNTTNMPSSTSHHHKYNAAKRHSATTHKNPKMCGSHLCYNEQSSKSSPILSTGSYSLDNLSGAQKSSSSSSTSGKDSCDPEASKGLDMARAKTSMLATDRAIQDIYAPLPSKALSWLTTRNSATRTNQCACSRVSPSASYGSLPKGEANITPMVSVQSKGKDKDESSSGKEDTTKQTSAVFPHETSTKDSPFGKIELLSKSKHQQQSAENAQKTTERQPPDSDANLNSCQDDIKKMIPDVCIDNSNSGSKRETPQPTISNVVETSKNTTPEPSQSPVLNFGRRRSRQLSLAALDLLPETAFGSDMVEEEESNRRKEVANPKPNTSHLDKNNSDITSSSSSPKKTPPRAKLVERMARLFEGNGATTPGKETSGCGGTIGSQSNNSIAATGSNSGKSHADGHDGRTGEAKISPKKSFTDTSLISNDTKELAQPSKSAQARAVISQRLERQMAPAEVTADTASVSSSSTKMLDKVAGRLKELHKASGDKPVTSRRRSCSSIKSDTNRPRSRQSSMHRQAAPPSPSFSSSSMSSSSSLSRRRGGGGAGAGTTKQKRLAKKSQLNKKIKGKVVEQRKKKKKREGAGKQEEKTYYCFSSDISDIDVVEVEDWETYSSPTQQHHHPVSESSSSKHHRSHSNSGRSRSHPHGNNSHHCSSSSKEHHKSRRERSVSRSRESASSSGGKRKHAPKDRSNSNNNNSNNTLHCADREVSKAEGAGDSNDEADDDNQQLVQEVYSMPPNSSEVCEIKGHREDGPTSPTASPELPKLRGKSKRTDIYKTKKSNNRLLSDLIIRNYDRQVFGNV